MNYSFDYTNLVNYKFSETKFEPLKESGRLFANHHPLNVLRVICKNVGENIIWKISFS